jgi:hypothetical protein
MTPTSDALFCRLAGRWQCWVRVAICGEPGGAPRYACPSSPANMCAAFQPAQGRRAVTDFSARLAHGPAWLAAGTQSSYKHGDRLPGARRDESTRGRAGGSCEYTDTDRLWALFGGAGVIHDISKLTMYTVESDSRSLHGDAEPWPGKEWPPLACQ